MMMTIEQARETISRKGMAGMDRDELVAALKAMQSRAWRGEAGDRKKACSLAHAVADVVKLCDWRALAQAGKPFGGAVKQWTVAELGQFIHTKAFVLQCVLRGFELPHCEQHPLDVILFAALDGKLNQAQRTELNEYRQGYRS